MRAIARIRRARTTLLATVAGATLLWAAVAAASVIILAVLGDLAIPLPLALRQLAVPAAVAGAFAAVAVVLWRSRHTRTLARVALYMEERVPALQFMLVTAMDAAGHPGARALERAVERVNPRGALRATVTRALAVPAAALALGLLTFTLLPHGTLERVLHPRPGDILLRPAARKPLASRLSPIAVRVEPPAYARQAAEVLEDPSSVAALIGSRLDVRGRGAAAGATDSLGAQLGGDSLAVAAVGDTWSATVTMPEKPAALRMSDRGYDRLLVLEPVIDEPPVVVLVTPARDTTYEEGKGRLTLEVIVEDQIGLARAQFELLHTSGGGEGFETARTITGRTTLRSVRSATVRATVLLDTMKLGPGDVLNIRAIAWDENDVTGPGKGESDTRTIRISDPARRDTVNVNPAVAAALDTSIISQRMLIMRADTLRAHKPRLAAEDFVARSLELGVRQGDLRNRVQSIVYELEHVQGVGFVGETPSSRILKQAGVAMLDGATELRVASVTGALPHMWRALRLLQKARNAKRYWLRGLLLNKPVDIDRIRLTGTDSASVASRDPRPQADHPRARLLERVDRALALIDSVPPAGTDSLRMILVDALTQAKDVTEPLHQAIDALELGDDPMPALVRLRRRLERGTSALPALSDWAGGS